MLAWLAMDYMVSILARLRLGDSESEFYSKLSLLRGIYIDACIGVRQNHSDCPFSEVSLYECMIMVGTCVHSQLLSTLALKPKYASQEPHIQFQVPQSIQNMCLSAGLPAELHQDLLFLYIRPHTQGRGE